MSPNRWFPFAVFLTLLLSISGTTSAGELLHLVGDRWPPYVDNGLPGNGLAMTLVKTALERAGYSVSISIGHRGRIVEGTSIGVFDVWVDAWPDDENEKKLSFSTPYMTNDIRFIRKKAGHSSAKNVGSLEGQMVGVVKGFYYDQSFMASRNIIKIEQNFITQTLNSLVKGEIDIALGDYRVLQYHLNKFFQHANSELEIVDKPLTEKGLCIGVSREHPQRYEILSRFSSAIDFMRRDGSYQKIIATYDNLSH